MGPFFTASGAGFQNQSVLMVNVLIFFGNAKSVSLIKSGQKLKENVINRENIRTHINAVFRCFFFKRNINQITMAVKMLPIAPRDADSSVPNIPQTVNNPHVPFSRTLLPFTKNRIKNGEKRPTKKPNSFLLMERKIFSEV